MTNNYISVHHRHPFSQGGANQPWNIIEVHRNPHNAWHTLVGNAPAIYIPKLLNRCCPSYNFSIIGNPENAVLKAPLEGFSKKRSKIHQAWICLFNNMTIEEILMHINTTWIDPRFKLVAYPQTVHWTDAWKHLSLTYTDICWLPSHEHVMEYISIERSIHHRPF